MEWFLITLGLLILLFGSVLLFGAPYVPTLKKQQETALDLLDLKPGQTLLELGCGDGRVLKAAAKRGLRGVGYELNPLLLLLAKLNTWHYRDLISVKWGNFWTADWPTADGIFVFLLESYMNKLHNKVTQYSHKPVKIVSFGFQIPLKKISQTKAGLYLYRY